MHLGALQGQQCTQHVQNNSVSSFPVNFRRHFGRALLGAKVPAGNQWVGKREEEEALIQQNSHFAFV